MNRKEKTVMSISEIARRVKAAFLKWLSERTEHCYEIRQKEQTVRLVLANRGNRPLTDIQTGEFENFINMIINMIKEMFGITANMSTNRITSTDRITGEKRIMEMHCKLQLQ